MLQLQGGPGVHTEGPGGSSHSAQPVSPLAVCQRLNIFTNWVFSVSMSIVVAICYLVFSIGVLHSYQTFLILQLTGLVDNWKVGLC